MYTGRMGRVVALAKAKNKELEMGKKVEAEHSKTIKFIKDYYNKNKKFPKDTDIYEHIAKDHLEEFKDYYTRLDKMEEEAKEKEGTKTPSKDVVIKFLKDNPNPDDKTLHKFAEKGGYNVHKFEAVVYGLATEYVKEELEDED